MSHDLVRKEHEALFSEIYDMGFEISACGSQITCDPAPSGIGTDFDFLIHPWNLEIASDSASKKRFDSSAASEIVALLENNDWKWEGSHEHYQDVISKRFMSWRKGNCNLIVTQSLEFAKRHKLATATCRALNLQKKKDRVALFRAFLYEEYP